MTFKSIFQGTVSIVGAEWNRLCRGKKAGNDLYKITLSRVFNQERWKEKCLRNIMKISGFDKDTALEKMNVAGSVIFEGDLLHTYLSLRLLDEIPVVEYEITPDFPYTRSFSPVCPDCGEEAVYKVNETSDNLVKCGCYCENCKEWVFSTISPKSAIDDTKYYIEASLERVDNEVKEKIEQKLNELYNKRIEKNKIVVLDVARNIEWLLGIMELYNIHYEIVPPYPHRVP